MEAIPHRGTLVLVLCYDSLFRQNFHPALRFHKGWYPTVLRILWEIMLGCMLRHAPAMFHVFAVTLSFYVCFPYYLRIIYVHKDHIHSSLHLFSLSIHDTYMLPSACNPNMLVMITELLFRTMTLMHLIALLRMDSYILFHKMQGYWLIHIGPCISISAGLFFLLMLLSSSFLYHFSDVENQ